MGVRFWGYGAGLEFGAGVEGMGSGQGLASRGLRLLASLGSLSEAGPSSSRVRTSRLIIAFLNSSPGSDVNEEGPDFGWDANAAEAESGWGVEASRGGVCGVLGTRDVSCVYSPIAIFR